MSYNQPSIESLEKPDENDYGSGERHLSPASVKLDECDNDEGNSLYLSNDYVKADFVEMSNAYDDIIADKDMAIRDDSYYGQRSSNPSAFESVLGEAKEKESVERQNLIPGVELNN